MIATEVGFVSPLQGFVYFSLVTLGVAQGFHVAAPDGAKTQAFLKVRIIILAQDLQAQPGQEHDDYWTCRIWVVSLCCAKLSSVECHKYTRLH